MITLAISILWLLLGIIVLLGVVWLFFYALSIFKLEVPEHVKKGVYVIILILIIIAALTMLVGGGGNLRPPSFR